MSRNTLLLAVFLILGMSGVYFLTSQTPLTAPITQSEGNNLVTSFPRVEDLSPQQVPETDRLNLTNDLVQSLSKNIVAKNPQGPFSQNGTQWVHTPDPQQLADDLLNEAKGKLDLQRLIPKISDSQITIISNNDRVAILNYSAKFDRIIQSSKIPPLQDNEDFSPENLDIAITHFQSAINQLFVLPVPKRLVNVHKTELQYLGAQLALLNTVKRFETDPLIALAAAESLSDLDTDFNNRMRIELQKITQG